MSLATPFLIANMRTGVERDVEPWLLPQDAFPNLEDCYLFRGRIQRRQGFSFLGRLVTFIGTATGANFAGVIPYNPLTPFTVRIIIGSETFYDDGAGNLVGSASSTGTVTYATGAINITFAVAVAATSVNYVNMLPCMGLRTYEITEINEEQLIGFDTLKANIYSSTNDQFQDISFYKTSGTAFSWTGTNSDFFYSINYATVFWATNFVRGFQNNPTASAGSGDGLRWYDGTGWVNFLPQVDSVNFLMGSLLIFSYRNRLVVLNTYEGSAIGTFTQYRQRARWSQNGTPFYNATVPSGWPAASFNADAWRDDIAGRGGYIDAPTSEQIVSAAFFRDTLVVFFERSTWQLRYTGNELLPFIWERINIELGAESTFSLVPFDSGLLAVGNYGIMSCDSTGINRIDQKIPDEVFDIHNGNDGVKRVHGIRDYPKQLSYWTFPSSDLNTTFPNKVLVYNYLDGSWAFFNDSFTCFGQFQPFDDRTWADMTIPWASAQLQWNSGQLQSNYPFIVAGNQQGYVFSEINSGPIRNSFSLDITNITQANPGVFTSPNHNLSEGMYVEIENVAGMTIINGESYRVSKPITANTFTLQTIDPNGNFIYLDTSAFNAYTGNGQIRVKNNLKVLSKRLNPFIETGNQMRFQQVDFFLERSNDLEFTANAYIDENDNTVIEQTVNNPLSNFSSKVWLRSYFSVIAQFVQLELTFSPTQMLSATIPYQPFTLHAMNLWLSKSGRLTYGDNF